MALTKKVALDQIQADPETGIVLWRITTVVEGVRKLI